MALNVITTARDWTEIDVSGGDYTGTHAALFVGTAGNINVEINGAGPFVIPVGAGYHAMPVTKVYNINTTASDLYGLDT